MAQGTDRCPTEQRSRSTTSRPLRVLHIGNVANNAYKNAKLLNEAGLECDVICYDYYHVMGAPEWEDADIQGPLPDQFMPDWSAVNLNGFQRPRWFAQGPTLFCIKYLLAKSRHQRIRARFWWAVLEWSRSVLCGRHGGKLTWFLMQVFVVKGFASLYGRALTRLGFNTTHKVERQRREGLVREFERLFPEREDKLTTADFSMYLSVLPLWKKLFNQYDIVQAYATDPILPLLAGQRPYIGFEHGTLREFPFMPTQVGRTAALGYALADGVLITNGDCLKSVPKLKIRHYAPMVHPVDERDYERVEYDAALLHDQLGVRYIFLCTLRHDWRVKGADVYLRALPNLAEALGRTFKVLMTTWGAQVEESKKLIEASNVSDLVHWIEPQPRRALIRLQKSVDAMFDQVALPHFGATAPEAIAAGVPVLMSYDPTSTSWIVSEPAPILPVWTPDDVVRQTRTAIDPDWREEYRQRAKRWFREQHSAKRVVEDHLAMYARVLSRQDVQAAQTVMET